MNGLTVDQIKRGNLADVRAALSAQVGQIVDYSGAHPLNAEMAPVKPAWYLVEAVPGQEGIAAAHLIARHFGIFVPDMKYLPRLVWDAASKTRKIERGEKLGRTRRMLAGYIFVFAWLDAAGKNWARIHAIPGVRRVVCLSDGKVVEITDDAIDTLRRLETLLCPIEIPADCRKTRRSGYRHQRRHEREIAEYEKSFTAVKGWLHIGDGQWIDTITALRVLDGRDENQAVAKALGLTS